MASLGIGGDQGGQETRERSALQNTTSQFSDDPPWSSFAWWCMPYRTSPSIHYSTRPKNSRFTFVLVGLLFGLALLIPSTNAAFVTFQNCLEPSIVNSSPLQLQWIPYFLDASYIHNGTSYNLNLTTYGNVSGQSTEGPYPPPTSPDWANSNETFGKFVNVSESNNKITTFFTEIDVLQYDAWNDLPGEVFCNSVVQGSCPIGPNFDGNRYDIAALPGFTVSHDFFSTYSFASFAATLHVNSGDKGAPPLACVSATVTPYLGESVSGVLRYLPAVILIVAGLAVIFAAIYSPWGSSDIFRWSSNYGRDEDLIRLVTPGFGDCLQYIQFVVLSGSLSLNYPGFYQPAISRTGWAALMFNESFVTHGNGTPSLVDGIYVTNATFGLERTSQLVGMTDVEDIWAGMAIWLLIIVAAVIALCQMGFAGRWLWRQISATPEEDLRRKNLPFTLGNVVRLVCNFFLLPIIALSMFQLVVAHRSPAIVIAMAIVFIVAVFVFLVWIFRMIVTTRPRAHLFDDLPTVLRYGPLYNTYSDEAAPFAFVPIFLTIVRGIAIGAVQQSGIAQVVLLAICEVVLILTLNAFRPYHSPTSMNAYQTIFSSIRLATVLLMVAFVPSLGVSTSARGWLGYIILLLHAIVLVFGFLGNALLRILEVVARMAGLGSDREAGAQRGGLGKVFGVRQLSRRHRRRGLRSSMTSDAAILNRDDDQKSIHHGGRSRSLSASSTILLQQQMQRRPSTGFDQFSEANSGPGTPGGSHSPFSSVPPGTASVGSESAGPSTRKPTFSSRIEQPNADPYYRPPRTKRATVDVATPGDRSRGSWASGDWAGRAYHDSPESGDIAEGGQDSPPAGAITTGRVHQRGDSSPNVGIARRSNQDYAVREVDFYYGVRGPALSNQPTRKLKTGPADPTGPVSSATGWFRGLFTGKTKDKGKGFEVVRSTRAPPPMMPVDGASDSPQNEEFIDQPYSDSPVQGAPADVHHRRSLGDDDDEEDDDEADITRGRPRSMAYDPPHHDSDSEGNSVDGDPFNLRVSSRVSAAPPLLEPIDADSSFHLPSRIGSQRSSAHDRHQAPAGFSHELARYPVSPSSVPDAQNPQEIAYSDPLGAGVSLTTIRGIPEIPRRSSRRQSSVDNPTLLSPSARMSQIDPSPPGSDEGSRRPSPRRVLDYGESVIGGETPGLAVTTSQGEQRSLPPKHRPQHLRVAEASGRMPFGSPGPSPGLTLGGSASSSRQPSDENMLDRRSNNMSDTILSGGGSQRSEGMEGRESGALGELAAGGHLGVRGRHVEERPASYGQVSQHRAGEGMRQTIFREEFAPQGSEAELVEGVSPAGSRRGRDSNMPE
ncbi:MAG: hypothetical protein M1822_006844 [Bathelium mastoideum]|nr:MAG: hypothetical protein M1822_006844 [Bathelium mastoideum]